jgi:hypothetical protein
MDAWDVRTLFVVVGLVIGLLYGLVAQATRFCVRRGVTDLAEGRGGETLTGWLGALLIAIPMTQWMMLDGHLSQEGMVYFPSKLIACDDAHRCCSVWHRHDPDPRLVLHDSWSWQAVAI